MLFPMPLRLTGVYRVRSNAAPAVLVPIPYYTIYADFMQGGMQQIFSTLQGFQGFLVVK